MRPSTTTVNRVTRNGATACFVCVKHRAGQQAQGGVIYEDNLVYAGHIHAMGALPVYRGHLTAEPKRHVRGLGSLTNDEAAAPARA
jgi:histidine triad (HIT) family protein